MFCFHCFWSWSGPARHLSSHTPPSAELQARRGLSQDCSSPVAVVTEGAFLDGGMPALLGASPALDQQLQLQF